MTTTAASSPRCMSIGLRVPNAFLSSSVLAGTLGAHRLAVNATRCANDTDDYGIGWSPGRT
jgi:hypothetical protein